MKYKRVISASFIQDIFTWVNSAYDVHTDMQSQSGGAMSIEWGVIHANPGKQKLNTKNSTEADVVIMRYYLAYNVWLLMFLLEQGYRISNNTVYQDNQSATKI